MRKEFTPEQFAADKHTKYEAGKTEHRLPLDQGFVGCPGTEAYFELVDSDNYVDEMATQGTRIPSWVRSHIRELAAFALENEKFGQ